MKRKRSKKRWRINPVRFTIALLIFAIVLGAGIVATVKFLPLKDTVPASAEPGTVKESTITIGSSGDIILHQPFLDESVYQKDGDYDFSPSFQYMKETYESVDFMTTNLETTLPGKDAGYSGHPKFKSPDAIADALTASGIDMFLLANNHMFDSGVSGFLRTSQFLADEGIPYTGARHSDEEKKYLIQNINGIDIGFINYVYETPGSDGMKGINGLPMDASVASYLNSFDPDDRESFYAEMEENLANMEKDGAEFIIAYMHWGEEYQTEETSWQREIAQRLCDMGVDALIGGHPHVVQPIDVFTGDDSRNTMFCAFSLGNQLSNQRRDYVPLHSGHTEDGLNVNLQISRDKEGQVSLTGVEYIPVWVYKAEGTAHYILPLNDIDNLEQATGLSGVTSSAEQSYERTYAIIGEGIEKVEKAYGF